MHESTTFSFEVPFSLHTACYLSFLNYLHITSIFLHEELQQHEVDVMLIVGFQGNKRILLCICNKKALKKQV